MGAGAAKALTAIATKATMIVEKRMAGYVLWWVLVKMIMWEFTIRGGLDLSQFLSTWKSSS